MTARRHEWEWAREWVDTSPLTGADIDCSETRIVTVLEDALRCHADDAAGGWVQPGWRHPTVTALVQVRVATDSHGRIRRRVDDVLAPPAVCPTVPANQLTMEIRR